LIVPPFGRYTPHLSLNAPAVDHADRGGLISITIDKAQELIWDAAGGRRDDSPIFTGASIQA